MKKRVVRYLKHLIVTLLLLLVTGASTLHYLNGSLNYGQNPIAYTLDNEGPYVFYENDSIVSINYLKGTRTNGFFVKSDSCNIKNKASLNCYFPLDNSNFNFELNHNTFFFHFVKFFVFTSFLFNIFLDYPLYLFNFSVARCEYFSDLNSSLLNYKMSPLGADATLCSVATFNLDSSTF